MLYHYSNERLPAVSSFSVSSLPHKGTVCINHKPALPDAALQMHDVRFITRGGFSCSRISTLMHLNYDYYLQDVATPGCLEPLRLSSHVSLFADKGTCCQTSQVKLVDKIQHFLEMIHLRIQRTLLQPAHGAADPLCTGTVHTPARSALSSPLEQHGNNFNHRPELANPFFEFFLYFVCVCARVSKWGARAYHATNPWILREVPWFLGRCIQGGGGGQNPGTCWKWELKTADGSAGIAICAHAEDNWACSPLKRCVTAWDIPRPKAGLWMGLSAIVRLACWLELCHCAVAL